MVTTLLLVEDDRGQQRLQLDILLGTLPSPQSARRGTSSHRSKGPLPRTPGPCCRALAGSRVGLSVASPPGPSKGVRMDRLEDKVSAQIADAGGEAFVIASAISKPEGPERLAAAVVEKRRTTPHP